MGHRYSVASPADLPAAEANALKKRRGKASGMFAAFGQRLEAVSDALPADTVGLALSGGGIRSATFCLGVFPALARHGVPRYVDSVSTVFGGGLFGGFLGGLISRRPQALPA